MLTISFIGHNDCKATNLNQFTIVTERRLSTIKFFFCVRSLNSMTLWPVMCRATAVFRGIHRCVL
jgi:hypothetical protein